jgi:hypothetical protein
MARPLKDTVDFFPHYAETGKTLYIIESKFKNDGYAFWFKLLQRLCKSKGHFIDCNNTAEWQFLQAITLVSEDIANSILNLLAELDAIDKDLWGHKIIWVENLVKNLTPIYQNRKQPLPIKPIITNNNPTTTDVSTNNNPTTTDVSKIVSTPLYNSILPPIVEQSRVEQSRVEIITSNNKNKYGEFLNVHLTLVEYNKLIEKFGEKDTLYKIEKLSSYIASKGKKYNSHYATILNWTRKDNDNNNGHKPDVLKVSSTYSDAEFKKIEEIERGG